MPSSSSSQEDRALARARKRNQVFPRTRTGCLTCRQRKKKCDETKPQCQACTRNDLNCSWPPHIVRIFGLDDQKIGQDSSVEGQASSWDDITVTPSASSTHTSLFSSPSLVETTEDSGNEDNEWTVAWSSGINAFLSPKRAGMLLPVSQALLAHYLENTAPLLSTAPAHDAPFIFWVMPLAYNDDLLMHSVLALSGAHLSFRSDENIAVQQATYRHYCLVLRTLRQISDNEVLLSDPHALLRVVLALVIMCHYEVLSGNISGSLFTHLRASRHLVLALRSKQQEIRTDSERRLYGFIMEVYSYLVLCNSVTPFGMNQNRTLVHDSFLQSIDDLKHFGAFGVMFGGGHGLFELLSLVSLFAAQQDSLPPPSELPNSERFSIYKRLKNSVVNWNPPVVESANSDWLSQRRAALEVCRHALLIFLETALSFFTKGDMERIGHIQTLIDVAISYLPQIFPSNYSCILMWPLMIIGSCMVNEEQKELLKSILTHNHYMMRNSVQGGRLLELLWEDRDEAAIGPYGLGLIMNKHGFDYGVI
ncbi:fungal-specific transcription factor domain-containing protein [Penicillium macrosclerotiorum]|uniref:fungal-specific transcription factor domain-containing protein n=1 Tax=Penicillium macrosclerotiorum TaxID=303699 RepID=UPI002546BE39|nr:fungal-specific transcription factor domain-containing protein [Penicillium macrosclerotiorum]KAJ5698461.1 fungal-specific transcription factor domain-containing protein [Penicillium macrosclerotiorum]